MIGPWSNRFNRPDRSDLKTVLDTARRSRYSHSVGTAFPFRGMMRLYHVPFYSVVGTRESLTVSGTGGRRSAISG